MSYRNKTYVIFDGDEDMWAYAYMKGWNKNENIAFNFFDAHELNKITALSSEDNTKRKLRERLASAKQVVVLVGDSTRNLFKFVRWEIDIAREMGLPIVAVNLNGKRGIDLERCPPILRQADAVHVCFKAKIIKYALDEFCANYNKYRNKNDNYNYGEHIYKNLGL